MGCRFDITVVATSTKEANAYIDLAVKEIKRIETLISSWDTISQTSLINQNAGIRPQKVNNELFELIERSINISKLTDGAFDITYASADSLWKFDGSTQIFPREEKIAASISKIGFKKISLNPENSTIFLQKTGMKIAFGAIGKGYAADKAKELLQSKGVRAGIINASGDMNTWGKKPNGENWQVAITNPLNKKKSYGLFSIKKGAVVTSGNYEKFLLIENKRYSHIINPKTGYPTTGIISTTVFAPKAELADALATAIFVLGIEVGIDRINQLPDVETIIIDEEGRVHTSKNIKIEKK